MFLYRVKKRLSLLIIFTLLLVIFIGCRSNTNENNISPHLKDIIPSDQEPYFWYLSPAGDKLLYDTETNRNQATIRALLTDREIQLDDCFDFFWLNNESIYCIDRERLNVTVYDLTSDMSVASKTSAQTITESQAELDTLLEQSETIYKLETGSNSLLILAPKQAQDTDQSYYIPKPENIDELLENLTYTAVRVNGRQFYEISEKVYSPDKNYYYQLIDRHLAIFSAIDDQLLVEIEEEGPASFRMGGVHPNSTSGWAADSSGIYFQRHLSSGFDLALPPLEPIQKLNVP